MESLQIFDDIEEKNWEQFCNHIVAKTLENYLQQSRSKSGTVACYHFYPLVCPGYRKEVLDSK